MKQTWILFKNHIKGKYICWDENETASLRMSAVAGNETVAKVVLDVNSIPNLKKDESYIKIDLQIRFSLHNDFSGLFKSKHPHL